MKKLLLFIFSFGFLFPHEFWIDYSNPYPEKDEKINIYIKGGHSFPESEIAVKMNLIAKFQVITPSGKQIDLKPEKGENLIFSEFKPSEKGTYYVYFIFQRPGGEVIYIGESFFFVEERSKVRKPDLPFEIVLKNANSEKEIEVKFLFEGKGENIVIEYMNEKGHGFIRGKNKIYKVQKGINLIKAEKGGKVCTLTFYSP